MPAGQKERLKNKNIIFGVTGSIAAYKAPYILRLLMKDGARVKVVMTSNAQRFIGKLTFETLSKNPVYSDMFGNSKVTCPEHISLADWGDLLLIAPATADIVSKIVCGICDDLLSTVALTMANSVIVVPAMNSRMWLNPIVKKNISSLKKQGYGIAGPAEGNLACGDSGSGRMAEPDKVIAAVKDYFK